ncbi:hypothetical protein Z517_06934 [Fonsecaea pedrosoi CBS 271.37]|uniref:Asl1-like glycosyl hydrolase catalytic domain-containing protein n=1 Tax=Fonsecaea pedrosoi CBS 271.37 TaxID=1442368 RepID=A0A0D2H6L2_9EURO|nr:uncharacterized protein Z517_06934 [Fonsecaea pedrosoi CBS 271.37]KIW80319.1 hypothetical protein Z517_06934 [Fonsecaea pedrosoi CBS 271.37]
MVTKYLSVALFASAVLAYPKRHERFHYGSGTGGGWAMPTGGIYPMNGTVHTKGPDSGASSVETPSSVVASAVRTVTVQPIPLDLSSPDTAPAPAPAFSSPPEVAAVASSPGLANTDAAPTVAAATAAAPTDIDMSSCFVLTTTITATSVEYVTVTATAGVGGSEDSGKNFGVPSDSTATLPSEGSAPSGGAGQFFGASSSTSSASVAPEGPGGFYGASQSWTSASSTTSAALGDLSSSSSFSLVSVSPTAGQFFPGGGRSSGVPSFGGSSISVPSVGSQGVPPTIIPTTLATVTGGSPASSPASSASSASSSVSSPSSPPSTGSSGKRGLSYNDASLTDAFSGKGMSWAYNWAASAGGQIVSGAEYVPMLWGQNSISGWSSAVQSAIAGGSKHALAFNEPDLGSQSNIDPATAAKLYIDNMNPLAGQVQLGSPAITNGAGTNPLMGIDWLNAFFKACAGQCKVDLVAFHWYDSASNFGYFQSHVQDVIDAAAANGVGKVWLTEFGASGSDSDVANFLDQAIPWLESQTAVERYAYFMCSDGILVKGNSISSPIGEAYLS